MNTVLITTAASVGIIHTILAIDHYLPFAVLSRAEKWSLAKTVRVVLICGSGHVLASVTLGLLGILLGTQLSFFIKVEEYRSEIAKWLLIAFGAIYMLIGIRKAVRNLPHKHFFTGKKTTAHHHGEEHEHEYEHEDDHDHDHDHEHEHDHEDDHDHDHEEGPQKGKSKKNVISRSYWPLFVVMVFGPCEFLIPLFLYPAAEYGAFAVAVVAIVFSICTVATMVVCTLVSLKGINMIPMKKLERYSHALTGLIIFLCGIAVYFFEI